MRDDNKQTVRRGVLYWLLAVGITILVIFAIVRISDLLTAWALYSWFFQGIREYSGFPDLLTGAIAVWLVALILLLTPLVFFWLIWSRKKAIITIAGVVSLAFVALYLLNQPREGYWFNPITGTARVKFARLPAPDCRIELFQMGYNFHPRFNIKLESLTPAIAQEYERQRSGEPPACEGSDEIWFPVRCEPEWVRSKIISDWGYYGAFKPIDMWVEKAGIVGGRTIVRLAFKGWSNASEAWLKESSGAYITDDEGTRYDLARDRTKYDSGTDYYIHRVINLNEVFRAELVFPKVRSEKPTFIYVQHPQFDPIKVDLSGAPASRHTPLEPITKPSLTILFSRNPVHRRPDLPLEVLRTADVGYFSVEINGGDVDLDLTQMTFVTSSGEVDTTEQLKKWFGSTHLAAHGHLQAKILIETVQDIVSSVKSASVYQDDRGTFHRNKVYQAEIYKVQGRTRHNEEWAVRSNHPSETITWKISAKADNGATGQWTADLTIVD